MLKKEVSREEIDNAIRGKGEYVQIDYLNRILATGPHVLVKTYAYSKLAEIYEKKKSYGDLGKTYESMAIFSINSPDKINNFMKAAEAYVKDGSFERADVALRKAMTEAPEAQRVNLYVSLKEYYKKQAMTFEKELKRAQAVKIYEKLLLMRLADSEKKELTQKLMELYEKLGKYKEKELLAKRRY
jgi:hypothetical protein